MSDEIETITEEWICKDCEKLSMFNDVAYNNKEECKCIGVGKTKKYDLIRREDVLKLIDREIEERKKITDKLEETKKRANYGKWRNKKAEINLLQDLKQKLERDD